VSHIIIFNLFASVSSGTIKILGMINLQ